MDVSVVIPSGRPDRIEGAVESVHADDTDYEYEVLVGTNGFEAPQLPAETIPLPDDLSIPECRNRLLEQADGDYIAVLDDDDRWVEGRFDAQAEFLDENEDVELVGSLTSAVSPDDFSNETSLEGGVYLTHSSVMYRSGWRYREKFYLAHDYDLFLRMVSEGAQLVGTETAYCERDYSDSHIRQHTAVQGLFATCARIFFYQRAGGREDQYDAWNPPSAHTGDGVPDSEAVEEAMERIAFFDSKVIGEASEAVDVRDV